MHRRLLPLAIAIVSSLPVFAQEALEPIQISETTSTMRVQIHHPRPLMLDSRPETKNFISNEALKFTSGSVIKQASEDSGLNIEDIRSGLKVRLLPNTDVVELTVPKGSRDMADALVNAYLTQRNRARKEVEERYLISLDDELQRHGDLVQERRTALTVLIQQYGIPYFEGEAQNDVGAIEIEAYRALRAKFAELQQRQSELHTQNEIIGAMDVSTLVKSAAAFDIPSNRIQELLAHHQKLERELKDTPKSETEQITALTKQADQAMQELLAEGRNFKMTALTSVALVDAQVEKLKERVHDEQKEVVELSMRQHRYNGAKTKYLESRKLHQELTKSQDRGRIGLRMPHNPLSILGWTE